MTTGRLDPHRLAMVDAIEIGRGQHPGPEAGACLMEAAAYLAGEPWSDDPACASPVVAGLLRGWNDVLPDGPRQELKRHLPRVIASCGTSAQERERAALATWWLAAGPGRALRGRARVLVEAAVTEARHHAPGTPPEPLAPLPAPRRVPRPVLDAMHDLIDRLLAVTEVSGGRPELVVEQRQRVARPVRRATRQVPHRRSRRPTSIAPELPE